MSKRKKIICLTGISIVLIGGVFASYSPTLSYAQETDTPLFIPDQFFLGKITEIQNQESEYNLGGLLKTATVDLIYNNSDNRIIKVPFGGDFANQTSSQVHVGEYVVIMRTQAAGEVSYYLADKFRLPNLLLIIGIFLVVVGYLGGKKGISGMIGLAISIGIIIFFLLPAILNGYNPYLVGFIGAGIIACVSLYVAHGWNERTTIALKATLITLLIAFGLSVLSVWGTSLFGLGSEEARLLNFNLQTPIDLQGLLIVAIILGALGVLDDTTVNQTQIVYELKNANPKLSRRELYTRSLLIGREHIASLVNTLFLAYIGAFLPLFIALSLLDEPLWITLNREIIGEEIIRSVMGSLALILAVPISSYLAARETTKNEPPITDDSSSSLPVKTTDFPSTQNVVHDHPPAHQSSN